MTATKLNIAKRFMAYLDFYNCSFLTLSLSTYLKLPTKTTFRENENLICCCLSTVLLVFPSELVLGIPIGKRVCKYPHIAHINS